uniref:Chromo domain-containing protein n=1 Tax=Panagrolaimus sp. JU765 TaxID=591449 RepID=A0AC34RC60_9BILA
MSYVWSEADVKEILKARPCGNGYEYLICWKNGEKPTWELRNSFSSKSAIFDKFDEKVKEQVSKQYPFFAYHQKTIRERTRDGGVYASARYEEGYKPKEIEACVEVYGVRYALLSYFDVEDEDFIRWDLAEKRFPKLTSLFLRQRGLNQLK